jgi:hypothetical protein
MAKPANKAAEKEQESKPAEEKKPVGAKAEAVYEAIEQGLDERIGALCEEHDDLGLVLLELVPDFRHLAVQTRHAELASRWDDMTKDEQLKRWRAFCHKWVEVKGITTFKGKRMDLDYCHAEYRGEVDPEECH